jgi:hypothetical protein
MSSCARTCASSESATVAKTDNTCYPLDKRGG